MRRLKAAPEAELQVVVTGMHLSPEFGMTCQALEADGFTIDAKIESLLSSDSPVGIAKSMALATIGFAEAFDRLRPEIVVMLGDRFEILAAAQAAMVARVPIAHVHGGEATEGLIDEAIRHSLTKMAHIHFTAATPYRKRVLQLGERPESVFNVGAPGLDNIRHLALMGRASLERHLQTRLGRPLLVATYHPVTLSGETPARAMKQMLDGLHSIPDATIVLTKANADTRGRTVNEMIDAFVAKHPDRVIAVTSLGQLAYLSLLRLADCVIGNSSSGILEAPALGTPTVNIGDRQRGRIRPASVIDTEESAAKIAAAIGQALTPEFHEIASRRETPFGDGTASERMMHILLSVPLEQILMKRFHDIEFQA
ncbi:UDP-N-acetylglucosamine 2-epimerase [Pelagibius sp.]